MVDPRKLVATGANFKRNIADSDLPRISEFTHSIDGVYVDVTFDRDEQGRPEMKGSLKAELRLECQRCLESMQFSVSAPVHLAIVWDEAHAKALQKSIDPWIVDSDEADLAAIIEEEILLHFPVVAKHDHDCLDPDLLSFGEKVEKVDEKQNPFDVLAELKK